MRHELVEARRGYEEHLRFLAREDELTADILREAATFDGSHERLEAMLFQLGPFFEFDPPLAALEDAVGAGGLSLIRSAEVRQALARYQTRVERDRREQNFAREFFASRVAPLWSEYTNVRDQLASGGLLPEGYPEVAMESRYDELVADPRFLNQIAARAIQGMRVRGRHEAVLEEIAILLGLLEPQ